MGGANPAGLRPVHRLDEFPASIPWRVGPQQSAVAPKLARIVYHLITTQQEYSATVFEEQERRTQDRKRRRLYAQAKELGFPLLSTRVCFLGEPTSASPAAPSHLAAIGSGT